MSRASAQPAAHIAQPLSGIQRSAAHRTLKFDPWTLLAFLYPLTQLIVINVVGQLFLMDILAVPLLVALLALPDSMQRLNRIWYVFALMAVWLFGQMMTDLIREAAPEDFLRGWAKIVFFAVQLAALWLWLPRKRAYMAAFAIGLGISAMYTIPQQFAGYEWKFGYDRALIYITLGSLYFVTMGFPKVRFLAPALLVAISFFLLFQAARSAFGVVFFAGVISAASLFVGQFTVWQKRLSVGLLAGLILGGLAAATGATGIYGAAVENGFLGRDALVKYRDQTSGDLPLILGGRSESLVSIQAIADSPIIGHGSWARDRRYVELHHAIKVKYGLPIFDAEQGKRDLIPTHSYLFGSWVEAGLAGGIFWLWILTVPFFALYHLLKRAEALLPLAAFCSGALIWSVLFSPFGLTERFFVAYQLVLLFWVVRGGAHSITLFEPLTKVLRRKRKRA